ncbi:hypothetical protein NIES4071_19160 [Calothrix sp. NIES-4071]|nr:hypothetical protein NIES4071_19160 [Calothrix sp. NIES-4071]BAZ56249.1 hypothetical protein NIES4105_19110 [Calothrix sp. NIES-4105]
MSISVTEEIQEKILIWKKRLAGDSSCNPLVDFRKNKKLVVNILTDSSSLYDSFAGDAVSLSFSQLETKQTGADLSKLLDDLRKGKRSLYSIMQRPLPKVDAETQAELDVLEKLFQSKS